MDSLESQKGLARVRERILPAGRQKTTVVKKPYHPPKLTLYGDLTEMTMAKEGGMRMADGGVIVGMRKT